MYQTTGRQWTVSHRPRPRLTRATVFRPAALVRVAGHARRVNRMLPSRRRLCYGLLNCENVSICLSHWSNIASNLATRRQCFGVKLHL
jgi:hypothetical protein